MLQHEVTGVINVAEPIKRSVGRPPSEETMHKRGVCLLTPAEHEKLLAVSAETRYSVSELLRNGLQETHPEIFMSGRKKGGASKS